LNKQREHVKKKMITLMHKTINHFYKIVT
jgi:hypothetical protein